MSVPAQAAPSAGELLAGLAGEWEGALGYRDYQSDKLFELPVRTTIENVPDRATQVRKSVFDEGARQAPVWITSLIQWSPDGNVGTATSRAGRPPEFFSERAEVSVYSGPEKWVIIFRRTGTDDDKPADIRVTETRTGDDLMSVKEVRPAGETGAPWRFRNQTRLRKVK